MSDQMVWCVNPGQTRHLQALLAFPDDLGARAILRRHYECPNHDPGRNPRQAHSDDYARSECESCGAELVWLPAKWATDQHVGPRRMAGGRDVSRDAGAPL